MEDIDFNNDFGFTFKDEEIPFVEDTRVGRLRNAIWPFLDNLAKNPEKDIHWPDRDVKIAAFKKKLQAIIDDVGNP